MHISLEVFAAGVTDSELKAETAAAAEEVPAIKDAEEAQTIKDAEEAPAINRWLKAIGGRAPKMKITDDDKSMAKAICHVLPDTTHHLCMWHILQKFPEHLALTYNKYPSFKSDLHHCIHDTISVEEFDFEWSALLDRYELRENNWLCDLYKRREKWIPAYVRSTFCASMSTTQRSESMNKFFKGFVRSSTLVSDFVFQYEKALNARYLKEKEKDVKTRNSFPTLKTCHEIEVDAAKIYTRKVFLKFQEELYLSQKYKVHKCRQEIGKKIYMVEQSGLERPVYHVMLDTSQKDATCTCHMFEFCGILCKHIIAVFVKKSLVDCLPPQYVMDRWRINARNQGFDENVDEIVEEKSEDGFTVLRNNLGMEFLELVESGYGSQKKYSHLKHALKKIREEFFSMDDEAENQMQCNLTNATGQKNNSLIVPINDSIVLTSTPASSIDHQVETYSAFKLKDPIHVVSKGRPKSLTQKHPKENQVRKKRKCSACNELGHNKIGCPANKKQRNEESSTIAMFNSSIDQN